MWLVRGWGLFLGSHAGVGAGAICRDFPPKRTLQVLLEWWPTVARSSPSMRSEGSHLITEQRLPDRPTTVMARGAPGPWILPALVVIAFGAMVALRNSWVVHWDCLLQPSSHSRNDESGSRRPILARGTSARDQVR